jgi:hypothetical protein
VEGRCLVVGVLVFLHHFQQYFSYIVVVSFNGGRKQLTCNKSLTNFIM